MKRQASGMAIAIALSMALTACGDSNVAGKTAATTQSGAEAALEGNQLKIANFVGTYELREFIVTDKNNQVLLSSTASTGWSGSATIDSSGKIIQTFFFPPSTLVYSSGTMTIKDAVTVNFMNDSGASNDALFTFANNVFTTTITTSVGTEKDTWVKTSSTVAKQSESVDVEKMQKGNLGISSLLLP